MPDWCGCHKRHAWLMCREAWLMWFWLTWRAAWLMWLSEKTCLIDVVLIDVKRCLTDVAVTKDKPDWCGFNWCEEMPDWCHHHHHHHQSLNRKGRWGTTDDFATSFFYFALFSTALWDLVNSRPVHSLMLSSYLFLCLPCLLPPFTVPCKMVLGRPDEQETWPCHCSLCLFTMVRRSLFGPIACWILAQTSSLVTRSLYEKRCILR